MGKATPLDFNDPAPDLEVLTLAGKRQRLSDLWVGGPLLLVFVRHFGCTQCKLLLDELVTGQAHLARAGLRLAVVTQGTPDTAAAFFRTHAPGLLALADPGRQAYAAYGLERGNAYQTVLSPKVWRGVVRAREKGYHLEAPPPGQDALQMGGLFVIGSDGRIRLPYYYADIADHPPLSLLLNGVLATSWDEPFDGPLGPKPALE